MIKKIIKLLLIIIWMGIIFSFSKDNGEVSTKKSDSVIIRIYKIFDKRELTEKEKEQIIEKYVVPIRKSAHFIEYFILGVLVISFISEFIELNIKAIIIGIIICCLYAVSDELHQLFISNRSAEVLDVFIDTIGSSTGIIIYRSIYKKILRRNI